MSTWAQVPALLWVWINTDENHTPESLERNEAIAWIISILLELNLQWLPDELQVFLGGGIDNPDEETVLKMTTVLVTTAKRLYPRFLVPWKDIDLLKDNYNNEDNPQIENMNEGDNEAVMSESQDSDWEIDVNEKLKKWFDNSETGRFLFTLKRSHNVYENIPYSLKKKDVLQVAKLLWKNPDEYMNSLWNVGIFAQAFITKWWDFLVRQKQTSHNRWVMKVLNHSKKS